jgi:hypothetical protein
MLSPMRLCSGQDQEYDGSKLSGHLLPDAQTTQQVPASTPNNWAELYRKCLIRQLHSCGLARRTGQKMAPRFPRGLHGIIWRSTEVG